MATKSDFTAEEWQILTWAVADAQRYVSDAHRGFLESFREAGAAEEFVDAVLLDPEAGLMRELAGDVGIARDPELKARPKAVAEVATARLREAVAILQAKAPEEMSGYGEMVLGLAKSTGAAVGGVSAEEADALADIAAALGGGER